MRGSRRAKAACGCCGARPLAEIPTGQETPMERDLALAYLRRNFPLITRVLDAERPPSITVRTALEREISVLVSFLMDGR